MNQEHKSKDVQKAIQNLLDRLCMYERSTGIQSLLILRQKDGFNMRGINGVLQFAPDVTDDNLLRWFNSRPLV